jgi:hypothetical protein
MKVLVLWSALALIAGCDPVYPFFVRNGLSMSVTARINMNGTDWEHSLRPGERLPLIVEGPSDTIERITLLSDGRVLYDFDKRALDELQKSVADPRKVTWEIQPNGLVPVKRPD